MRGKPTLGMRCRAPTFAQRTGGCRPPAFLSSVLENCWLYIQDIKLEGVTPSLGMKLYLVWNQVVGRISEEKVLDRGKQGTERGAGDAETMRFCGLT
jgi:hypothetical protein